MCLRGRIYRIYNYACVLLRDRIRYDAAWILENIIADSFFPNRIIVIESIQCNLVESSFFSGKKDSALLAAAATSMRLPSCDR